MKLTIEVSREKKYLCIARGLAGGLTWCAGGGGKSPLPPFWTHTAASVRVSHRHYWGLARVAMAGKKKRTSAPDKGVCSTLPRSDTVVDISEPK